MKSCKGDLQRHQTLALSMLWYIVYDWWQAERNNYRAILLKITFLNLSINFSIEGVWVKENKNKMFWLLSAKNMVKGKRLVMWNFGGPLTMELTRSCTHLHDWHCNHNLHHICYLYFFSNFVFTMSTSHH